MAEITNAKLRLFYQAVVSLKQQEFFPIPSHRIKVAARALFVMVQPLDETLLEISRRHGKEAAPGQYAFDRDEMPRWLEEAEPLMAQMVELPKLKGITWDDISAANAKISAANAEVLEETEFLTGDPDPDQPKPKEREATVHASV